MNSSKWIPWKSVVPLMLTNREVFADGPFYVGTAFWVKFPPYDDVFLVTAWHVIFDEKTGELKGSLSVPIEQHPDCRTLVRFSAIYHEHAEHPEDVVICVVDPEQKEQLEQIGPRCLVLDHQDDIADHLTAILALNGKLRTVGFPGSDKAIDYDNGTAYARPRGFNGVLVEQVENGRYRLDQASWKDADGDMDGYSGSPILGLFPTEMDLDSLPRKMAPTKDGRIAVYYDSNENIPHRAVPVGVLVTGSNNIAHFVSINVATELIACYLREKYLGL